MLSIFSDLQCLMRFGHAFMHYTTLSMMQAILLLKNCILVGPSETVVRGIITENDSKDKFLTPSSYTQANALAGFRSRAGCEMQRSSTCLWDGSNVAEKQN